MGQLAHDSCRCCSVFIACDCVNTCEDADGTKQSGAYEVVEAHICSHFVLEAFSKSHLLNQQRIIFLKFKGPSPVFNLAQCPSMILCSL